MRKPNVMSRWLLLLCTALLVVACNDAEPFRPDAAADAGADVVTDVAGPADAIADVTPDAVLGPGCAPGILTPGAYPCCTFIIPPDPPPPVGAYCDMTDCVPATNPIAGSCPTGYGYAQVCQSTHGGCGPAPGGPCCRIKTQTAASTGPPS
jgi:hypothetical protein